MKSVLIDSRAEGAVTDRLERLGYRVIALSPSRHLPPATSAHPDSLMTRLGGEIITFADYCDEAAFVFSDIREYHPTLRISFSSDTPCDTYPADTKYNALVMGKRVFARAESLSATVRERVAALGYELIPTRQGYPACTTLALDASHAITADKGMARVLAENGVEVTLIEPRGIMLPPYEYGFIGGATGVDGDKVYFVGDLASHPSGEAIEKAVRAAGLHPVSLSDGALIDIGGLIFLHEA